MISKWKELNILAFDEILREFDTVDSMYTFEYNEFVERANSWYAKLEVKPLGFGINRAKEIHFFNDESIAELERICDERNFVVHRLFKEDLFKKDLETNPSCYFLRLETLTNDMYAANESLNEIFKAQKAEHKMIW